MPGTNIDFAALGYFRCYFRRVIAAPINYVPPGDFRRTHLKTLNVAKTAFLRSVPQARPGAAGAWSTFTVPPPRARDAAGVAAPASAPAALQPSI